MDMAVGAARWILDRPVLRHCVLLGVMFAIAQLFQPQVPIPVRHGRPAVWDNPELDTRVTAILKRSCQDCHSSETRWPWYARISPGSWVMSHHVRQGRQQFNLSDQFTFSAMERGDIADSVNNDSMPPKLYLLLHPSARLSDEDRDIITDWAAGRFDSHFKPAD